MSYHPMLALGALCRLVRNREDTKAGADLLGSMAGRSWERLYERWRKTHTGQTVTAQKLDLAAMLRDEDYLASLPAGSLGRAYHDWMQGEGFDLTDFQESLARSIPLPSFDEDAVRFYRREKAAHDLWHLVTGYGRNFFGETCLVFFMWPQHRNTGLIIPMIVSGLYAFSQRAHLRDVLRRSREVAWLPGVLWESMLSRQLEEVQRDLGLRTGL